MDLLAIKQKNKKSTSLFNITLDLEYVNNEDENEHENLEVPVNQLNNAASEVVRLSKLDESLKIFDNVQNEEESDDKSNDGNVDEESRSENESNITSNSYSNFIKATEIQHILGNNQLIFINLPEKELEETIFRENNSIDVY